MNRRLFSNKKRAQFRREENVLRDCVMAAIRRMFYDTARKKESFHRLQIERRMTERIEPRRELIFLEFEKNYVIKR